MREVRREVETGFRSFDISDVDMVTLDPGGLLTSVTQSGNQITVTIDRTDAANTVAAALVLLWPLKDNTRRTVPASSTWNPPQLVLKTITPPTETSDMWAGCIVTSGPTIGNQYSGGAHHYDEAGGPDRRKFTNAAAVADTAFVAGATSLVVSHASGPNSSTANAIILSRLAIFSMDSSDDGLGSSTSNGSGACALAPHIGLIFGGSSAAGSGTATIVFEAGYIPAMQPSAFSTTS